MLTITQNVKHVELLKNSKIHLKHCLNRVERH